APEGRSSPNANQRGAAGKRRSGARGCAGSAPVPAPGSARLGSPEVELQWNGNHSLTEPLASLATQRIDINGFDGNLQWMLPLHAATGGRGKATRPPHRRPPCTADT